MLRRACCLAIVLLAPALVACDVCDGPDVVENATIRSQDDLDDLEGVLCILGDLNIGENDQLLEAPLDLGPLSALLVIEGDLDIRSTTALTSLELPHLTFVGRRGFDRDGERVRGGFFVFSNLALADLDLDDLTDVGGCTELIGNPALDPDQVDDLFLQVRSHAFPGTCDGAVEAQSDNGAPPA